MKREIILVVLALSSSAAAQSPRFALSTHATSIDTGERIMGGGATFAYSFTRRFSVESTLNFFPGDPRNTLGGHPVPALLGGWHSGNVLQGLVGLRANLLQTKRADVFLTGQPGFVSYSHLRHVFQPGLVGGTLGTETVDRGRQTYFAPFFGAGAQLYPTQRTFLRFEVGGTVIRYSDFTTTINIAGVDPSLLPIAHFRGTTAHTFQFSTGFGFRFGGTR